MVQGSVNASAKITLRQRQCALSKMKVQPYLRVVNPRHRLALTKLLLGDHSLAVEVLRRSVQIAYAGSVELP